MCGGGVCGALRLSNSNSVGAHDAYSLYEPVVEGLGGVEAGHGAEEGAHEYERGGGSAQSGVDAQVEVHLVGRVGLRGPVRQPPVAADLGRLVDEVEEKDAAHQQ